LIGLLVGTAVSGAINGHLQYGRFLSDNIPEYKNATRQYLMTKDVASKFITRGTVRGAVIPTVFVAANYALWRATVGMDPKSRTVYVAAAEAGLAIGLTAMHPYIFLPAVIGGGIAVPLADLPNPIP